MLDRYDIVRLNIFLSCECGQEEGGGGVEEDLTVSYQLFTV